MAFTSEICGFEGGDFTGVQVVGGSVLSAAARSGVYGFRAAPVATKNFGCQVGKGISAFGSGAQHASFQQFCYRMQAAPSANNAMLCGNEDLFYVTVDTNMAGTVHVAGIGTTSLGFPTPSNTLWFRVQMRQWTSNVVGDLFGTAIKHFQVIIDHHDANGVLDFVSVSTLQSAVNIGFTSITPLTLGSLSSVSGADPQTWQVDYDDCIYVAATNSDVTSFQKWSAPAFSDYGRSIFYYDVIEPIYITGQGPMNDFTPASDYTAVNEVPSAGGAVTGSSGATNYYHQPAPGTNIEAFTLRVNANASVTSDQGLLVDLVTTLYEFPGTGTANVSSPFATYMYPTTILGPFLTPAQFNAKLVGVSNQTGANITLRNIYIEVLTGEPILVDTNPFDVTLAFDADDHPGIEEDIVLDLGPLTFGLTFQGAEINVPVTWQLERFDIGPRLEETS